MTVSPVLRATAVGVAIAALLLISLRAARSTALFERALGLRDDTVQIAHPLDDSWAGAHCVIAHGLGAHRGEIRPNSTAAFRASYVRGHRVFEVDLARRTDGELVAAYSTKEADRSADPRDLDALLALLAEHPDARLVLDLKTDFRSDLRDVVAHARRIDPALLDRIIPQLYFERHLADALALYPFSSFVYTLYRTNASDEDVIRFVRRSRVGVVTMSERRFNPALVSALADHGARSFVHTINSVDAVAAYRTAGIQGIYSDQLTPADACGS